MILSNELTPHNVETVLHHLGIERNGSKSDTKGWITIKSPLRDERNPSFGLNLNTGAWHDHGTDESGDIVTLTERLRRTDTTGAIHWIKDQVGLSGSLQSDNSKVINSRNDEVEPFWTAEHKKILTAGQKRLENEHDILEDAALYDCLSIDTLKSFGCGIVNEYKNDWLAFPYDTGCQLYRRNSEGKVIRQMKGSAPKLSFFGTRRVSGDKPFLYIAKSPRETMLLHQEYSNSADVIGLASGEMGNLSNEQAAWLTSQISKSDYRQILVFLDCDTETAYQTAKSLAMGIKEIAPKQEVLLVNIYEYTGGIYKDFTDCVRDNMPEDQFQNLLDSVELIPQTKQVKQTKQVNTIQKDDLKLDESLIDLLPPVVKNYLIYAAPLSDVPNEFLITPFLANCGALIGKRRYVEVGGMNIYPAIWTVLFAGSSTLRKSTAISLAKRPFKPIEDAFKSKYEKDLQTWKDNKQNSENAGITFDEQKPIRRTLYCSDGFSDLTFWEDLRDNGSIISTPGEFTALWSELTRPRNSMKDLALSIFDAEESIRRNTKNAGNIELNNPVWCIAGATTLTNFQRTLSSTERASGLLQRILPVCMEERTKAFQALTELQKPNSELYNYISENLSNLKDMNTRPVPLSDEANRLFTDWSHELNGKAEKLSDTLTDIGGFVSRLNVYGLKFALIFQQLDRQNEPISKDNMRAAIRLCDWLLQHIIWMMDHNYIFNRMYADRLKIREILEKQPGNMANRTDLMNLSHFDKEQLDKVIASEVDAGFIEEIRTDTGGVRQRVDYKLNHTA